MSIDDEYRSDYIEINTKMKKCIFSPGDESSSKMKIEIFLKFRQMNLHECLESNVLIKSPKANLAVEIAFDISHIHGKGMIHRDLQS